MEYLYVFELMHFSITQNHIDLMWKFDFTEPCAESMKVFCEGLGGIAHKKHLRQHASLLAQRMVSVRAEVEDLEDVDKLMVKPSVPGCQIYLFYFHQLKFFELELIAGLSWSSFKYQNLALSAKFWYLETLQPDIFH